jgi:hypothetical protein
MHTKVVFSRFLEEAQKAMFFSIRKGRCRVFAESQCTYSNNKFVCSPHGQECGSGVQHTVSSLIAVPGLEGLTAATVSILQHVKKIT